jgi:uncharacterized membrane protein SpoIIM required for sporulation
MLESLINPEKLDSGEPATLLKLFGVAFAATMVSVAVVAKFFPESTGLLANAFVLIVFLPLLDYVFRRERRKEIYSGNTKPKTLAGFLVRHNILFWTYGVLFLATAFGFATSYVLFYNFSPTLFKEQINVLQQISAVETRPTAGSSIATGRYFAPVFESIGNAAALYAKKDYWSTFSLILKNNLAVLMAAIFLSFLYGVGGMFLILWNASVIGVLLGFKVIEAGKMLAGVLNFVRLLPHGIFEIAAYFIGGISGVIFSMALYEAVRSKENASLLMLDVMLLVIYSLIFLFLGALIEAFLLTGKLPF